jgi:deoxyribodipyrimidine photolyase-related protein
MKLRLILGDQLSSSISALKDADKDTDVIMMCELRTEAVYVKHHKKKIAFLFSAMRHFAADLCEQGFSVRYTRCDDPKNTGTFLGEVECALKETNAEAIVVTYPTEYRLRSEFNTWSKILNVSVDLREDDRFLCSICEFNTWARGRKQLRMEYFYREMRRKYTVLMDGSEPVGGKWNYDAENRKPPKDGLDVPKSTGFDADEITQDVFRLVEAEFPDHFGDLYPFQFAVTRDQALEVLEVFIRDRLSQFGDFQDAMVQNEPWMFHSHISFYLNCGLLDPLECIQASEEAYHSGAAPLNAVEGFIRQILGWREFIRGIYWLKMPDYKTQNSLNATRTLPDFFWTADTQMNCLHQCIYETKTNAYAHHIQRLMVLGNFALIAGLHPDGVNEWYLTVYADAYEWVELPNVSGMVLFADHGLLASKPYAASGAYINRMSDYCKSCYYQVAEKSGSTACPFNYLYWDFLDRNAAKLRRNPRMGLIYKNFQRMSEEKLAAIRDDSTNFFKKLDINEKV